MVIATWRSGCAAALELTAAAMTENAQMTTKTAHGGFMKVPPQTSDKSAEGVLEHERDSFSSESVRVSAIIRAKKVELLCSINNARTL